MTEGRRLARRLLKSVGAVWLGGAVVTVSSRLLILAFVAVVLPTRQLADLSIDGETLLAVLPWLAFWSLLTILATWLRGVTRQRTTRVVREALVERLMEVRRIDSLEPETQEHLHTTLVYDVETLGRLVGPLLLRIGGSCLVSVGALGVLFYDHAGIAVSTLVSAVAAMAVLVLVIAAVDRATQRHDQKRTELSTRLREAIEGLPTVISYGAQPFQSRRISDALGIYYRSGLRAVALVATLPTIALCAIAIAIGGPFLASQAGWIDPLGGPTEVVRFLALVALAIGPLFPISGEGKQISEGTAAWGRIKSSFDMIAKLRSEAARERTGAEEGDARRAECSRAAWALVLDSLDYRYDSGPTVLSGLCARIEAGRITWLVGPNGSGKSTLLDILAELRTATRGKVRAVGDVPPSNGSRFSVLLRQREFFWREPTVSNIALDRSQADLKPGWSPGGNGRSSLLAKVVDTLGSDQLVTSMSGGQRQRVAIARALVSGVPLVLLDEPFGSLDEDSRARLLKLLRDSDLTSQCVVVSTHDRGVIGPDDAVLDLSPREPPPV